ncbi:hypothetical protein Q1695_004823 [Nippostrongylus brasiliensis]|nr:hypothetical protein Q1695_004823 [Nippostrongylus brasiliensis]
MNSRHIKECHAHAVTPKAVQRDEDGIDDDEEEPNPTDSDEGDRRNTRSLVRNQHKCQTCEPSDVVRHIRVHTGRGERKVAERP